MNKFTEIVAKYILEEKSHIDFPSYVLNERWEDELETQIHDVVKSLFVGIDGGDEVKELGEFVQTQIDVPAITQLCLSKIKASKRLAATDEKLAEYFRHGRNFD